MKTHWLLAALVAASFVLASSLIAADEKVAALKCPVSGKAVNPASTVEFNGGKVAFCCDNCPKAFAQDTEKYAAKANLQLVQSGQLKQIKCPLTGKALNPTATVDVAGVQVGLCCNNCKGKVEKASGDEQINLVFKDTSKGYETVKK